MAEKAHLMQLATCIQQAAATYDPSDRFSWMKIETALEGMRQAIQPPDIFLLKQRFHVCLSPLNCHNTSLLGRPCYMMAN